MGCIKLKFEGIRMLKSCGFDEFGRSSSRFGTFVCLSIHAFPFLFLIKFTGVSLEIHMMWRKGEEILEGFVAGRLDQESKRCSPCFLYSLYLVYIQTFMNS